MYFEISFMSLRENQVLVVSHNWSFEDGLYILELDAYLFELHTEVNMITNADACDFVKTLYAWSET